MESFVARQPIFGPDLVLAGYELLFRSGPENAFRAADGDQATGSVISAGFMTIGLEAVTGGRQAFLNVTREVLLGDLVHLLPKDAVVLEILETVAPEPAVLDAIRRLRAAGYRIALDDFQAMPDPDPFIELADIIKVDWLLSDAPQRKAIVSLFRPMGITMLAEKVETHEAFAEAKELGCTLFQGYFFSKPVILARKRIAESRLGALQLLQAATASPFDFRQVEAAVKRDMSMSYKLLRYINSAFFGISQEVRSIRQALTLLGEINVRRWASLVALASVGEEKPDELLASSIVRARFCERVADTIRLGGGPEEGFFLGLFSLLDAMLDQPMAAILEMVPLSRELKGALCGERNRHRQLLDLVTAYERGDWGRMTESCRMLGADEMRIPADYADAMEMAWKVLQASKQARKT